MVPSDGSALAQGGIIIWFDDITNTANGTADVCITINNDANGDANGNNSNQTNFDKDGNTLDKNADSSGNKAKDDTGGGRSICF